MIKGNKIALTGIRHEDSNVMYGWINDPETVRFNAPYFPIDRQSHDTWFASIGKSPSKVICGIRALADDALIGVVQFIDVHPVHRTAELTTRIGKEADRNKGYGTEALKLAVDFAWRDLNLQRIWLRVFSDNERAIRAYKKAQFEQEGVMRRACWIDGKFVDEVVMSQLRTLQIQ